MAGVSHEIQKNFVIEQLKGTHEFEIEIIARVTHGGSNFPDSDEPRWGCCDILSIYNPRRNKEISQRLKDYLIMLYGDWFEEDILYGS